MNDNEVMTVILKHLISHASNSEYIEKLNSILKGIENFKHIEEERHYRYQSILLFGVNIFPFQIQQYREMAKELLGEN